MLFPSSEAVIWSYWAPLGLSTLASLLLVLLLTRRSTLPDEAVLRLIFNWSLGFAAVCALAFPVFTQDMWLSAVWGRMISTGINPYYNLFTPDTLQGLPLDHFPMVMSYGPLWGVLSAMVTVVANGSILATGILFKAVLAIGLARARFGWSSGSRGDWPCASDALRSACSAGRRPACRNRWPRATTILPWSFWSCCGCI